MADIRPPRSIPLRRLAGLWPWVVAFAPALVTLIVLVPLRVPVPHLDGWAFVQQYHRWFEGRSGWREFFDPHYIHPVAVGRAIYFAVFRWLGGDLGLLPLLNWGLSVITAICVCLLSRPLWTGNRVLGAVLMSCATLTIFSPAQGEVWIWDFLFQNAIPGTCLAAGLVVLSTPKLSVWRILAAALLSLTAMFSFGTGLLVGILLSMLIWHGMNDRTTVQRRLAVGAWLATTGVVAWIALTGFDGPGEPFDEWVRLHRPLMEFRFVLILLGQMLGKGTVFEPEMLAAVMGGGLMIVFVACLACVFHRRHDRKFLSIALPWIAFGTYGLASAVLIAMGRMHNSISKALAERYITFALFFVIGTMLLAATVALHGTATPAPIRLMRKAAGPALVLFIAASAVNWERGRQAIHLKIKGMEQERALLCFATVMPLDPEWTENRMTRKSTFRMAKFLADQGLLRGVNLAPDNRLASFQRDRNVSKQWARFDKPMLLDDGRWSLRGMGGLSKSIAADLILITAESLSEEERIIAVTAPLVPDTLYERQANARGYPEHFFGWSQTVDFRSLPKGTLTLRAYVLEQHPQRVRPIEGIHTVDTLDR